jgi:hypothetical protein
MQRIFKFDIPQKTYNHEVLEKNKEIVKTMQRIFKFDTPQKTSKHEVLEKNKENEPSICCTSAIQRKLKFGLIFGEIVIEHIYIKKPKEEEECALLKCCLCKEHCVDDMIKYVNCRLKGIKNKKIGYYKYCDTAICTNCIKNQEQNITKGDVVRFKYEKKIGYRKKKTIYNTGKISACDKNGSDIIYNIYCTKGKLILKIKQKDIMYKLNTCPWCESHRLCDWRKNTQKFSKTKKGN